MLLNYDSIYHLHIPRTSGIFIQQHLSVQFRNKTIFASNHSKIDLGYISQSYLVSGHFGTTPIKYMKNPLIFTVLRNPVDRYISYLKYTRGFFNNMSDKKFIDMFLYDDLFYKKYENSQFKFLTCEINVEKYNLATPQDKVENNWFIEYNKKTINDAKKIIDNSYVYIFEDIDNIINELPKILKIDNFKHRSQINASIPLNFYLNKKHYDRIRDINLIDMEIYEYAKKKRFNVVN